MGIHQAGAGRYPQGTMEQEQSQTGICLQYEALGTASTVEQIHSLRLPHLSEKATKEIAFLPVL